MLRRHEMLPSNAMGRKVHVWCYGHWGVPVVVFPTAAGFAHEWEAQGMFDAIGDFIEGARIKLYCPESNVSQAWTNKEEHPASRVHKHHLYERFVIEDLVPFIRSDCRSPNARLVATGASLGGFYAANFALKFPEVFRWALCMSGRYEITNFTGGFSNADIYYNNPLAYVPHLEGESLDRVRTQTHLTMVCGQGAWEEGCIEETIALCDVFQAKGIPHDRDIWGHDVSHNWVWWKRQARYHFGRFL
jgi:esterase/lipase superfamily enzyme